MAPEALRQLSQRYSKRVIFAGLFWVSDGRVQPVQPTGSQCRRDGETQREERHEHAGDLHGLPGGDTVRR